MVEVMEEDTERESKLSVEVMEEDTAKEWKLSVEGMEEVTAVDTEEDSEAVMVEATEGVTAEISADSVSSAVTAMEGVSKQMVMAKLRAVDIEERPLLPTRVDSHEIESVN